MPMLSSSAEFWAPSNSMMDFGVEALREEMPSENDVVSLGGRGP